MLLLLFRCHSPIRSHAASFSSSEGYIRGGARSRNHVTISHVLHASICAPVHGRPHSGAMAVEDSRVESQFNNAQVILDELKMRRKRLWGGRHSQKSPAFCFLYRGWEQFDQCFGSGRDPWDSEPNHELSACRTSR
jgi:hypothetical protein